MVDEGLKKRFQGKYVVRKDTGCWEWTAALAGKGYGQIKLTGQRKQAYAHRVSYMIHKGDIPEGKEVLHACDNPKCVNPNHLSVGTQKDNLQDMKNKGRHLFGEKNANCILTETKVRAIKQLLDNNELSQLEIGNLFGISQMEVSRIKRGLRWKHIT